jgi:proteasome lid subunit RPN8/RPN11
MMPPAIIFTQESWETLRRVAEEAYPFEGCGLLIGPLTTEKRVSEICVLKNKLREEGRGRFDFSFSPKEFVDAQSAVEKRKLDIVGIYHTHPDHPPRPSATDASQPMLAGWINVIASVHGGKFKEAKAWWREDETRPFVQTESSIEP